MVVAMIRRTEGEESDGALMVGLARGEMAALGALYARHRGMVVRALRRAVPGLGVADEEDLAEEVFLELARIAPRYAERERFAAWLYGIALCKARNFRRKTWLRRHLLDRHVRQQEPLDRAPVPSPLRVVEEREAVAAALALLTDAQREVLELRVFEGFSGPQIAEILGIRPKTVKNRMHLARAILVRELGAGAGSPEDEVGRP
jgi:RNA polymerase sigma-70 factor (ECF subfamily)